MKNSSAPFTIGNIVWQLLSMCIGVAGLIFSVLSMQNVSTASGQLFGAIAIVWCVLFALTGVLGAIGIALIVWNRQVSRSYITRLEEDNSSLRKIFRRLQRNRMKVDDGFRLAFQGLEKAEVRLRFQLDHWFDTMIEISERQEDQETKGLGDTQLAEWLNGQSAVLMSECRQAMLDEYSRFVCSLINRTQDMIESYLDGKGMPIDVSVTLKLFVYPDSADRVVSSGGQANLFTAYRDTRTYESGDRNENPPRLYTINRNSDYIHCINGHNYYTFNNNNDSDISGYANENEGYSRFYNSGVTVLVESRSTDLTRSATPSVVYGFLACDALNLSYSSEKLMDDNVASIMMTMGAMIGSYCNYLEYVWVLADLELSYGTVWYNLALQRGVCSECVRKGSRDEYRGSSRQKKTSKDSQQQKSVWEHCA